MVRCGKRMSVVGFVTDAVAIGRILALGAQHGRGGEAPARAGDRPRGRAREVWGRAGGVGVRRDERAVDVRKRAEGRDYRFPE